MNELFKNEMKTILKDEYDDFIQSLQKPPVKAFYLNPLKKDCLHYFNQDAISPHPVVPDGYYFDYEKYPLGKSPFSLVVCIIFKNQVPCLLLIF